MNSKNIRIKIVGYTVSILFLYLTFKGIDPRAVVDYLKITNIYYLILSIGLTIIFFWVRGVYQNVNLYYIDKYILLPDSLTSIGIAQFYNIILPARMGEIMRIYFLSEKYGIKKVSLLSYVLVEKLLDVLLILVLLLVIIVFLIQGDVKLVETFTYFVSGLSLVGALIILYVIFNNFIMQTLKNIIPKKIFDVINSLNSEINIGLKFFKTKKQIVKSLLLLLLSWTCIASVFVVISYPYIELLNLPIYSGVVFMVFSALALSIPSAPAGIGVVHYGLYLAISILGGDIVNSQANLVAAFVISTHFFVILFDVLVGASIILWSQHGFKRINAQ